MESLLNWIVPTGGVLRKNPEQCGWVGSLARVKRLGLTAASATLLAIALSACTPTGPEPVPLDQNPGDNGAPTATGS